LIDPVIHSRKNESINVLNHKNLPDYTDALAIAFFGRRRLTAGVAGSDLKLAIHGIGYLPPSNYDELMVLQNHLGNQESAPPKSA